MGSGRRLTHGARPVRLVRSAGLLTLAALLAGAAPTALVAAEVGVPPVDSILPKRPKPFQGPHAPNPLAPGPGLKGAAAKKNDPNAKMLMEAKELVYDYDHEVVTAVGGVDIYYDGRALQADKVIYDQKANRVKALGRVKMTERTGDVVYADSMDVTDNFKDGFVEPLRLETVERTHFAAAKGRRENGNTMVFDRGVYTACEPCRENPDKPPLWQVKAKRIIWRQDEKTIYYENASFEFFGVPIAWVPYFSSPDPTVKRRSGFLAPKINISGDVGVAVEIPYYWVLSPTSDATLSAVPTTKQGVMLKGEYRQQLIDGAYSIRAAGIHQFGTSEFSDKIPAFSAKTGNPYPDAGLTIGPGDKKDRWAVSTKGEFAINEKWTWGWDVNAVSDKWVRSDYDLWGSPYDATSTLYLTGQGDRSWFEARAYQFYGLTRYDQQDRLPWVAPVIDYNYVVDHPVAGGELAFNINATNVYREDNDYARYRMRPRENNALVGAAGLYSRISGDVQWRRQFIDPIGQVWTPFAFMRGDLLYTRPDSDANTAAFLRTEQDALFRGMAGVGLEYRFPFVAETSDGAHQIEPIAQIILRPNETKIGRLPNEDAQSLIFDDTVLFAWDKFSGYDRIEGGSRANVGAQYTFTSTSGATFAVLAGQSYQLWGKNSFAAIDATRTGLDTGLDTTRSDYVAGATFAPNQRISFGSHFRFDEDSFHMRSMELAARANFDRIQANVVYGRYDQQPLQGYDALRKGVLAGARVYLKDDIYVEGGARYNFDYKVFDRTQIGFGIDDIMQCLALGFTYIREVDNTSESINVAETDHKFLVRVDLRTLGGASVSTRNRSSMEEGFNSTTALAP